MWIAGPPVSGPPSAGPPRARLQPPPTAGPPLAKPRPPTLWPSAKPGPPTLDSSSKSITSFGVGRESPHSESFADCSGGLHADIQALEGSGKICRRLGRFQVFETSDAVGLAESGQAPGHHGHRDRQQVVAKVLHGLAKVMHGLAAKVTIGVANGVVAILGIPPLTGIHGLTIRLGRVRAVVARTKRRRVI